MRIWEELILIGGLSMDGFAASVCLGMELGRKRFAPIILSITGFHVGMLLLGHALGTGLKSAVRELFPWVAAAVLLLLGIRMLRERKKEADGTRESLSSIMALAFATSLDAATVGTVFSLMEAPAWRVGFLTLLVMGPLSVVGAFFGSGVSKKHRLAARTAGGTILTLMGLRLLAGALGWG